MNQPRPNHTWRSTLLALLTVLSMLIAPMTPVVSEPIVPAHYVSTPSTEGAANRLADLFAHIRELSGFENLTNLTAGFYNYFFAAETAVAQTGAPGGISTNLTLWLKADAGITSGGTGTDVTQWDDQSGDGHIFVQDGSIGLPLYETDNQYFNFNPSLDFVFNTQSRLSDNSVGSLIQGATQDNYSFFAVFTREDNDETVFSTRNTNDNQYRFAGDKGGKNGCAIEYEESVSTPFNETLLVGATYDGTPANRVGYYDGLATVDSTCATFSEAGTNGKAVVGDGPANGTGHAGHIAEIILYDTRKDSADAEKINSYLAIKYGVTLDQSTPTGYLASDGSTTMWDSASAGSYNSDIAGIGLDNGSGLNQKQSKSTNVGSYIAIGLGGVEATNSANTNTFGADKTFLTWGNNGLSSAATNDLTGTQYKYMNRVWKVQETGTVGQVEVRVRRFAPINDSMVFIRSTDPTFTNADEIITLTDNGDNTFSANIDFNDGDYFTLARTFNPSNTCASGAPAFVHGLDDTGTSGVGLSVWLSNGDGTFNPNEIAFAGFDRDGVGSEVFGDGNAAATYLADINNDGTLDIVHATETGGNAIYVYLNNGNNTFDTTAIATTGMQNVTDGKVFAGQTGAEQGWLRDTDGDGNLDYIFSGDDNNIHVYLGNGDGTFATNRITTALSGASNFKTSGVSGDEGFLADDVNGDGSVDLIGTFVDSGTGRLQVWLGNGDGTFNPTLHFNALLQDSGTTDSSGSANNEYSQFADVNGDGALDYLHTEAADSTAQIWAFLNNGDGTFQTTAIVTTATATPLGVSGLFSSFTSTEQSFFVDVTEDGQVDYVTSYDDRGANSGISVYIGNGDGTFATTPTPTTIPNFGTGYGTGETTFIGCGFVAQTEICNNGIDDDLDGLVDSADPDCGSYVPSTAVPMCTGALAFIHGADDNGTSGLGTSVWLANGNGTFSSQEISFSGFDRDNVGSEVFGDGNAESTYFADVNNDGPSDIVHATETGGNAIYVYLNNGDNTFDTTAIATTGMQNVTDGKVFAGQTGAEQGWLRDTDGDGNLDYIFSGDDNNIHVYLGNGDGTFATNRITTALSGASNFKTSGVSGDEGFLADDVNGDGSVDLIGTFVDSGTGRLQVWLGNGDGTFNPTLHFNALLQDSGTTDSSGSANNEYSQFADVNGDGALDYLHTEAADSTAQIWAFLNNGDGTFQTTATTTTITNYPLGTIGRFSSYTNAERSFFADANNDGIIDYVTSFDNAGLSSGISVYLGNGNGTFSNSQIMTPLPNFATGTDTAQTTYLGCGVAAGTEICGNNIDEDFDGLIDQQDPDASCYIATNDTVLTKAFSPSTIAPNGVSTLIFTISENASDDGVLNTVNFVDTLPAGVTITNTASIANNCTGGMVTANAGGNTIRVQSAILDDGAGSCTISVPVTASAGGTYTNGASNMSSLVGTETSSMTNQTLTVSAGLTDVDGDGIDDTEEGTGCVGAAGAHAPPVVVDTNVLSSTLGCIATDTDNDGTPDNVDECPNTPAGGVVDTDGCPFDTNLAGSKTASVSSFTPGTPFDYIITISNNGAEAHNVEIMDVVAAGLTINGTPVATNNNSTGGACTVSGQVVTCTWDIMNNSASETVTINVTP